MKPLTYHKHAWNSWWIRIYSIALQCQPSSAFKYFSECEGYQRWLYLGPIKITIRKGLK